MRIIKDVEHLPHRKEIEWRYCRYRQSFVSWNLSKFYQRQSKDLIEENILQLPQTIEMQMKT